MSDLIAVADTAWSVRRFLHLNMLEICRSLDETARPEFVELINALNEHMPLSEDGKDWTDDAAPFVPHAEYARVKTHLYHRIETLKARAEAAEAALVELTHQHHRTLTPGRGHQPQSRGWADCACLTCKRTAELVPEVAASWRRCECRARYGPDADGTLPAVAMCSHAAECAARIADAPDQEDPHG